MPSAVDFEIFFSFWIFYEPIPMSIVANEGLIAFAVGFPDTEGWGKLSFAVRVDCLYLLDCCFIFFRVVNIPMVNELQSSFSRRRMRSY